MLWKNSPIGALLMLATLFTANAQAPSPMAVPTAVPAPWQTPSANAVEHARSFCVRKLITLESSGSAPVLFITPHEHYLRCVLTKLGLWSDSTGFNGRRFAKLLTAHRMPTEVAVVVDHCSRLHRQPVPHRWAYAAYRCATAGRLGVWMAEHLPELGDEARSIANDPL